ncbi:hypothetical protein C0Q70_09138 [Pomacea canaliculata]|uniref:G-protein coupled receptors family 1 profile domain-containing protein n=1 Tax=Pomacea canaliculata TaxID=400727 RepID=A0A2T7P8Z8_POMCA|nr:hypothetical protein C0Q70_09138 [Pomacea canaliculata]
METDANEDFGTDLLNLEVTSSPLSFEVNVTNSTSDAWTTMSMTNISEVRQLVALTQDIKRYYIWVILAFGFPGNLASLVVILRMRCFGSPALYVATLAVVDNLALIVKLLMLHVQKVVFGTLGCKFLNFLGNHLVVYANWILIALAIERFVAVWEPLRISRTWTPHHAAVSLSALVIWQWVQTTAYSFVPCVLLITFNLLIALLIGRARRLQRSLTPPLRHHRRHSQRHSLASVQRQATIMLVVTSVALVLTTTPVCVYLLVQQWWRPLEGTAEADLKHFVKSLVYVVCDANHSVNFYLYFVSARSFRSHVYKMLPCTCLQRNKVPGKTDQHGGARIYSSAKLQASDKDRDKALALLSSPRYSPSLGDRSNQNR